MPIRHTSANRRIAVLALVAGALSCGFTQHDLHGRSERWSGILGAIVILGIGAAIEYLDRGSGNA